MADGSAPAVLLNDGVVALRRPAPMDAPAYCRMRNNLTLVSAVMGFRLGVSEDTVGEWIARGGVEGDDLLLTAVLVPDAFRPIGYVKMFRVDRFSRHAWIGLSLFDEGDGRHGYGRRMLAQACDYLRDFIAIRKVSLEVLATNAAALALYAELGFVEEGRLKSQFFVNGRFDSVVLMSRFLADPPA